MNRVPVSALQVSGTSDVTGNDRFSEGIWKPDRFLGCLFFMPMNEKRPDGLTADLVASPRFVEILRDFKGVSVERVEGLIDARVLFTKSNLF